MLHCIQKNIFWDDAYTQILLKVYLLTEVKMPIQVPLKVQTIEQQPQSQYSPSYGIGIHHRII